MELFRNIGIKPRIIFTALLIMALPIGVFCYIRWMEISVNMQVFLFLSNIFLFIGLLSGWLVSVSITRPIDRVRKRLETFIDKKAANPLSDHGDDEITELAADVNKIFTMWNNELTALMKKHKQKGEEVSKIHSERADLEQQLNLARSCLKVAQSLNTTFDFHSNLKTILDEAVKTMNVQWASVLLINRESLEMTVACVRGIEQSLLDDLAEDKYPSIKLKPNEGLAGQVIKGCLPLIANKGFQDARFKTFSEFKVREERIASILCSPIKGSEGNVLGVVNFINRISPPLFRNEDLPYAQDVCILVALVIERNRLYRNLFSDEATGLISHKVWRGYYDEEVARAVRYAQPLSVVVLDIDKFKDIIDATNPEFALQSSSEVGRALQNNLRETDLASRVQDRFYLLLPNTNAAGSVFFVGRVKEALEKLSFEFKEKKFVITLSAGISSFPESAPDARMMLENAGKALEQAKSGGRNRAVIFGRS